MRKEVKEGARCQTRKEMGSLPEHITSTVLPTRFALSRSYCVCSATIIAPQTALPVSSTAYHRLQRRLSMYTVHTTKVSAFRFLVLEFTKKLNHTTRLTRAKQSYIQKVQERSHSVASINGRRKPCPTISSIRDLHFNAISRPRSVSHLRRPPRPSIVKQDRDKKRKCRTEYAREGT